MSLSDVDIGLESMRTGLGRAAEIATAADRVAGDIAARMYTAGFRGIAQAMSRVRQGIDEVRVGLVALRAAVDTIRESVTAAPQQPTPQQTIDILSPVAEPLRTVNDGIGGVLTRLGEVQQHAAMTLRGGQPGPMLAILEGVRTVLVAVAQRCAAVQQLVDNALVQAREAGAGSRSSTDPAPEPFTFVRARADRKAIKRILPHVGRGVAAGQLYDIDGHVLTPIVGPGDTGAGTDLIEPYRSMRFVPHVESNATALMRRNGVRQAVLYTNMRPCLGEDGCTINVRDTLPVGYKLTVFQVMRNGSVQVFFFEGTGKGVTTDARR